MYQLLELKLPVARNFSVARFFHSARSVAGQPYLATRGSCIQEANSLVCK
jgi:hypothetical protein